MSIQVGVVAIGSVANATSTSSVQATPSSPPPGSPAPPGNVVGNVVGNPALTLPSSSLSRTRTLIAYSTWICQPTVVPAPPGAALRFNVKVVEVIELTHGWPPASAVTLVTAAPNAVVPLFSVA